MYEHLTMRKMCNDIIEKWLFLSNYKFIKLSEIVMQTQSDSYYTGYGIKEEATSDLHTSDTTQTQS